MGTWTPRARALTSASGESAAPIVTMKAPRRAASAAIDRAPAARPDCETAMTTSSAPTQPGSGPDAQACTGRAAPDCAAATKMSATAAEPRRRPRRRRVARRRAAARVRPPAPGAEGDAHLGAGTGQRAQGEAVVEDAMASSSSSRASSNTGAAAQPSRRARSTSRTGTPDSIGRARVGHCSSVTGRCDRLGDPVGASTPPTRFGRGRTRVGQLALALRAAQDLAQPRLDGRRGLAHGASPRRVG